MRYIEIAFIIAVIFFTVRFVRIILSAGYELDESAKPFPQSRNEFLEALKKDDSVRQFRMKAVRGTAGKSYFEHNA